MEYIYTAALGLLLLLVVIVLPTTGLVSLARRCAREASTGWFYAHMAAAMVGPVFGIVAGILLMYSGVLSQHPTKEGVNAALFPPFVLALLAIPIADIVVGLPLLGLVVLMYRITRMLPDRLRRRLPQ